MSEKPTLHEIAAMPFPLSQSAIRRFYDADWGKEGPEFGEREFSVTIQYETREEHHEVIEVRADTVEMAEEKARDIFDGNRGCEDEIINVQVKEVSQ